MNNHQQEQQTMNKQPEPVAERQFCGFILAILGLVGSILAFSVIFIMIRLEIPVPYPVIIFGFNGLSGVFTAIFFAIIVSSKEYLKGKPEICKIWPLIASSLTRFLGYLISGVIDGKTYYDITQLVSEIIILAIGYAMYFGDDNSGSCCLCFKPYIFRAPAQQQYA